MKECPVGSEKGFINFVNTSGIDLLKYQHAGPQGFPFFMNYAPRSTPITHSNNYIEEDSQNTLTYRGAVYTINNVQICNNKYGIYGSQPNPELNSAAVATIIFTFIISDQSQTNLPSVMLLVVPIYKIAENPTNRYLLQIINPPTTAKKTYPSMQKLFQNQPSFGYMACLPTVAIANTPETPITLMVFTFINGIVVSTTAWNTFTTSNIYLSTLQPYKADGRLLGGEVNTILAAKSNTDERTINLITYYPMDIRAVTENAYVKKTLLTNQYQCQPFDQLNGKDPKGAPVTLETVITGNNMATNTGFSISFGDLLALWVPIAGIMVIVIGLGLVLYFSSGKEKVPPPLDTATAATPAPAPA
jgi:hypothetical protein